MTNRERVAIVAFCDTLIPGGDGWPPASAVIADAMAAHPWLVARALTLPDDLAAGMARLEAQEPDAFRHMLRSVYDAYYSAAGVRGVVRRLAESGPRETEPSFDAELTRAVLARRAGSRP